MAQNGVVAENHANSFDVMGGCSVLMRLMVTDCGDWSMGVG